MKVKEENKNPLKLYNLSPAISSHILCVFYSEVIKITCFGFYIISLEILALNFNCQTKARCDAVSTTTQISTGPPILRYDSGHYNISTSHIQLITEFILNINRFCFFLVTNLGSVGTPCQEVTKRN